MQESSFDLSNNILQTFFFLVIIHASDVFQWRVFSLQTHISMDKKWNFHRVGY